MRMRQVLLGLWVIVVGAALPACDLGGEDEFPLEGTGISIDDIAGTWIATKIAFSPTAPGPAQEVEVVAQGGSGRLMIQSNGRFTLTITLPGEAPEVTTGQLGFDEDLLVVIYDDEPDDFEYFAIQSSATTLSIRGPASYDFDGDGFEEAASAELDFDRG